MLETQDLTVAGAKAAAVKIVRGRELPSFEEWRHKNSAVMIPDRGFRKQLKVLDPDLEVVWDWGSEKWNIWRFPKGRPGNHVLTVETKDKSYRELGADVLLKLMHSYKLLELSTQQFIDYFDELDNQNERRKARDFSNKIEGLTKEVWDFHHRPMKGTMIGWRPIRIQVPKEFRVRRVLAGAEA